MLDRISLVFRHLINGIGAVLVLTIAVSMALQVFQRFVMNQSLGWPDELVGNLLAALAFVGGAIAMREGEHIRVRVLWYALPRPLVTVVRLLADAISVAFLLGVAYISLPVVARMWRINLTTLEVPVGLFMATVPVFFVVSAWYVIRRSVLTGPKDLEH